MKALLIGRHTAGTMNDPDLGEIQVIAQRNVQFPSTAGECQVILRGLVEEAHEAGAALLFQAVPGQVAVALAHMAGQHAGAGAPVFHSPRVGIIISVPGERPGTETREFEFGDEADNAAVAEQAVKFANPRARTGRRNHWSVLTVKAEQPMLFVFSHIEEI